MSRKGASANFLSAPEQTLLNKNNTIHSRPIDSSRILPPPKFQPMATPTSQRTKRASADAGFAEEEDDDDEDEDEVVVDNGLPVKNSRKRNATSTGRRKIDIQYIDEKSKRHVSFTKRKSGLMKKAFELSTLTGCQCLVLVVSDTGLVYTYATPLLKPVVSHEKGKAVILASLDGSLASEDMSVNVDGLLEDVNDMEQDLEAPIASTSATPYYNNNVLPALPIQLPPPRFLPPALSNSSSASITIPITGSPPSSSTPQTPYELSIVSHAAAFASYKAHQNQVQPYSNSMNSEGIHGNGKAVFGNHNFTEEARYWKLPDRIEAGGSGRSLLEDEAAKKLLEARTNPSLASYLEAHLYHTRVSQPTINSPVFGSNGTVTQTSEATLEDFGRVSALYLFRDVSQLKEATHTYLTTYLPTQQPSPQQISITRQHLTLFFDFLESYSLITIPQHNELLSFSTPAPQQPFHDPIGTPRSRFLPPIPPPASNSTSPRAKSKASKLKESNAMDLRVDDPETPEVEEDHREEKILVVEDETEEAVEPEKVPEPETVEEVEEDYSNLDPSFRGTIAATKFGKWVKLVKTSQKWRNKFNGRERVSGWFEIYRVRKNYVLLKERELKGDSAVNTALSPFKVRIPTNLTPLLRIDDVISCTIQQVVDSKAWVPIAYDGFQASTETNGEESDIDPLEYQLELDRLYTLPGFDPASALGDEEVDREEKIAFNKEVMGQLERARYLLEEGDLSDEN